MPADVSCADKPTRISARMHAAANSSRRWHSKMEFPFCRWWAVPMPFTGCMRLWHVCTVTGSHHWCKSWKTRDDAQGTRRAPGAAGSWCRRPAAPSPGTRPGMSHCSGAGSCPRRSGARPALAPRSAAQAQGFSRINATGFARPWSMHRLHDLRPIVWGSATGWGHRLWLESRAKAQQGFGNSQRGRVQGCC
jgi:hypothetical protein